MIKERERKKKDKAGESAGVEGRRSRRSTENGIQLRLFKIFVTPFEEIQEKGGTKNGVGNGVNDCEHRKGVGCADGQGNDSNESRHQSQPHHHHQTAGLFHPLCSPCSMIINGGGELVGVGTEDDVASAQRSTDLAPTMDSLIPPSNPPNKKGSTSCDLSIVATAVSWFLNLEKAKGYLRF